jgi:catechol 2,3-dioxygenase-like lactoylglutathione lyase family enzyme
MHLVRRRAVALAAGLAAVLVALAGSPPAMASGQGKTKGPPGLVGVDHAGITVPDIDEAVAWFEDVMGCSAPLTFGPFSDPTGTFMQDLLGVHPRAVIEQITMIRCGRSANIELFEYDAPDQRRTFPKNSDWAGHHIAFYVTDIDAAVAYMQSQGVEKLLGPLAVTDGPAAGQSINYFRAPFGTYIELISYPKGMAYEETAETLLWDPRDNRG